MTKEQSLVHDLTEMIKDTKAGKVNWKVICKNTE